MPVAVAPDRSSGTPLGAVLDIFRIRQLFNVAVRTRDLLAALRSDAGFVDAVRRAALPLPFDPPKPAAETPFPEHRTPVHTGFAPHRLGLVVSGGSGALASVVGVARALEEAHLRPDVISLCSGSALFGFPLAAGLPADEVARFTLGLDPRRLVDPRWAALLLAVPTAGRGLAGILGGQGLEDHYRDLLGDLRLGDLPIPAYAPIWNIEENRVEFLGPKTYPDLPVARAVRMAVALPLFFDPVELGGGYWCDGGIVDVFPIRPVLDIEEPCDAVVAINGFYPSEFAGEDADDWRERALSILHVASQVRTAQHVALARENLATLRARADTVLLEPVPYSMVRGVGFYRQFIDTSQWPQFMRAGRSAARSALRAHPVASVADRGDCAIRS